MLGGDDGVGHPEARVRTGGEHPERERRAPVPPVATDHRQIELGSFGAPDPVALHGLDPLGPLEGVKCLQQLVGIGGDPQEPLLKVPLHHQVTGALARPVGQYLFVSQDGLAPWAPVDWGVGPVGQAGLQEAEEDRLGPSHVLGIVAADFPPPVVDRTQADQGLFELGDPCVGENPGVCARLDGGVLRRKAERVEAERRKDAPPQHRLVANDEIPKGVVADVALVGRPRGVRVHTKGVEGGIIVIHLVGALVEPPSLPFPLDGVNVVGPSHGGNAKCSLVSSRHARGS